MSRFPHVQAVLGPSYEAHILDVLNGERRILVGDEKVDFEKYSSANRKEKHSVYVSIMKGCDDFCTYCIVPFTRGRVQSRDPESILEEVRVCVDNGAVEITLLGQNVNDYGKDLSGWDFVSLVERVATIDGVRRIRFMSPHPANFKKDDITRLANLPQVAPYYHLPLQSGDDEILRRMNRKYTTGEFAELVGFIREACLMWRLVQTSSLASQENLMSTFKTPLNFSKKCSLMLSIWRFTLHDQVLQLPAKRLPLCLLRWLKLAMMSFSDFKRKFPIVSTSDT